jgi:hypothetical protein
MPGRRIDLCGVSTDVETDHAEFDRYLASQFPASGPAHGPADVAVRVRWTDGPRAELTPHAVFPGWPADVRLDRHVWAAPGALLCLRCDDAPQIAVASAPAERPRRFEIRFHFSLDGVGWRETARRAFRWRRLPALRENRLSTLAYYAVYYPAWWHLEAQGLAHPLHAAGVALRGRAVVLGGLPGCGKSTLATALLGDPDAELLADNIVLHDGAQVFGCFEPLLLDAATRASLAQRIALEPLGRQHQYARDAFHAPHRTGGVPVGAAVVVGRGRATALEPLAPSECARLLLAANEAAKEVRRYHVLSALLALGERETLGYVDGRIADLDRLLAGVPCYWLQVRDGAPHEATGPLRELACRATEMAI